VPPVEVTGPMTTGSGARGISHAILFGLSRGNAGRRPDGRPSRSAPHSENYVIYPLVYRRAVEISGLTTIGARMAALREPAERGRVAV
jgi:hypothetical protein